VKLERTAVRVWKSLTRDERSAAAATFWEEPPQEVTGAALGAIVRARHMRPQVARSMSAEERAVALAGVPDPGELVASSLLVALHLGHRREMLTTFLDALGLPHQEGILADDDAAGSEPLGAEKLQAGMAALRAKFDDHQVETYLNTLWLQDPERWGAVASM
jgi:hypothetical protein